MLVVYLLLCDVVVIKMTMAKLREFWLSLAESKGWMAESLCLVRLLFCCLVHDCSVVWLLE